MGIPVVIAPHAIQLLCNFDHLGTPQPAHHTNAHALAFRVDRTTPATIDA